MELNTNIITDMSELSKFAYASYENAIEKGKTYFGTFNLTNSETGKVETFNFNSRYTVIETTDSLTSMQAVLLKNEDTGKYVISFRGTQESGDYLTDFIIGLTSAITGTVAAYNLQYSAADEFVDKMLLDYAGDGLTRSNLTLTGHSLGGILAQTIASKNSMSAYTFNALGTSGLTRFNNTSGSNILNFSYTDDGLLNGDILSNALTFAGNEHLGEVVTMFGPNIGIAAHKMEYMTMVIDVYNTILKSFSVDTDYRDISQGFRSNINIAKHSNKDTFFKTAEYLAELEIYEAGVSDLKYNFLTEMTAYELQQNATNSRAAMFALIQLNGFTVEGNLAAYTGMDLKTYSEKYVEQRSLFLYTLLDPETRSYEGKHFFERGIAVTLGDHYDKSLERIIFGYDGYETYSPENLIGGDKDDHIFGMGGDDTLFGGKGNDYLEGGEGADRLYGGKDFDTYVVDNGDNIYDSDGAGEVIFNDYVLEGGTIIQGTGNQYEGKNGEYYVLENNTLSVYDNNGNSVVINSFNKDKNDLGIELTGTKKDIELYAGDATVVEGGSIEFEVGMNVASLDEDLLVDVAIVFSGDADADDFKDPVDPVSGTIIKTMIIKAGYPVGKVKFDTFDDIDPENIENFSFAVTGVHDAAYIGSDLGNYSIMNAGTGTITDNEDVHITISSDTTIEGNPQDNNILTFKVSASRELAVGESVTLDLSIQDITTDWADYGFLSKDVITFDENNREETITLELFGDVVKEGDETLSIDATVRNSTNLQNLQIISGKGTITDDDTGATPYDDILILTDENNVMDALAGDDYVEGKAGDDILTGNSGNDILWGGADNDMLYGDEDNDILFGDSGDDYLEGGTGNDTLYGGEGADVLLGGDGSDYLNGGAGFDYYITGNGDIVEDSDGKGAVFFNNADLSGTKKLQKGSTTVYEDDNNTYEETGGGLLVTSANGESITIAGYSNKALGIVLQESDEITVSVGDAKADEAEEMMKVSVELGRELVLGEELVVDLGYYKTTYSEDGYGAPVTVAATPGRPRSSSYNEYDGILTVIQAVAPTAAYTYTPVKYVASGEEFVKVGSVTFKAGDRERTYTYTWKDNNKPGVNTYPLPNPLTLTAKENEEDSIYSDSIKVIPIKEGTLTIDDSYVATQQRYDPLVLDTNKDGFISTTSLADSNTYFDLTGDGLREKVGWVKSEDALLTFDKNENGQIDGIGEVFGSADESGFDELRRVVDSNYDNKIDKRDELFNSLSVWNDINGDAKVQEGELRSLDEAGITSIDLNALETNIDLNGNLLSEASKYTDAAGNKELVADILLNTDLKDTKVDVDDIPNYSIDETTRELPHFAGSGLVYDSFILYNIDEEFKAIAKAYATDIQKVQDSFETYVEHWSGYTNYVSELEQRYSVDNFTMAQSDKQAWITERFLAKDFLTSRIESYYETSLNNSNIPTKAVVNNEKANTSYTALLTKAQSTFTILAFYQDEFSDTHYDIETDKFVIDDEAAFNTKIADYFNSTAQTTDEKLYLAKTMQMQGSGLNFDVDVVTDAIDNEIIKTFVKDMFLDRDVILGTEEDDIPSTGDVKSVTLGVTEMRYNSETKKYTLACGNKTKSINNSFYMPCHVEIDVREVA